MLLMLIITASRMWDFDDLIVSTVSTVSKWLLLLQQTLYSSGLYERVEFEDAEDSGSSSGMDEYESEDELGDMFCSPRPHKHTKSVTSHGGRSKVKPQSTKPPVAAKPTKSSSTRSSASTGVNAGRALKSDNGVGSFLGMKEYMDAMDRELAKTTVGKSFVRHGDEEVGFGFDLRHCNYVKYTAFVVVHHLHSVGEKNGPPKHV